MFRPEDLHRHPNALAPHYSRFRVAERILLTGHSHQAWPDRGLDGQMRAWLDAAALADDKWERAFAAADRVRRGYARLLGDTTGSITLGASTHELVVRFLSALPIRRRPRLVTTDGEFHTIRRQLDRLEEEGLEIVRVPSRPASAVAERLSREVDGRTAAVLISSVFYRTGHIVPGLGGVLVACRREGAELLIDAYHHLNAIPFSLEREGLEEAFVVGGGYKYCQLGEGVCFLRAPPGCVMRPVVTGWFGKFEALADSRGPESVFYEPGPARFAGATYDPTSHYRAAEVFDFFEEHGLDPVFLREVSRHQVDLLAGRFDALDADPAVITRDRSVPLEETGGFLVLRAPGAEELSRRLAGEGVRTDFRGDALRLGPAPYLSDDQLRTAVGILGETLNDL